MLEIIEKKEWTEKKHLKTELTVWWTKEELTKTFTSEEIQDNRWNRWEQNNSKNEWEQNNRWNEWKQDNSFNKWLQIDNFNKGFINSNWNKGKIITMFWTWKHNITNEKGWFVLSVFDTTKVRENNWWKVISIGNRLARWLRLKKLQKQRNNRKNKSLK